MYLLAAAFFSFGVYSAALGDPSHAMYAIGVGAVLAGARYILGSFQDVSLHGRISYGSQLLILIIVAIFGIDEIFG